MEYISTIDELDRLRPAEREGLRKTVARYAFRASEHYLSLIDWDDPSDPIRRLIIPDVQELDRWGALDSSNEKDYTILPGLQHKYSSTALLLVSDTCGGICRYCFRKRIFIDNETDRLRDLPAAVEYLRAHREITNVLLTGGDPLTLSTARLRRLIDHLLPIDHVRVIRIGTKMLAFNPYRILDDPELLRLAELVRSFRKAFYVVTHFNHDREITAPAVEAISRLHRAGAVILNQTPLIRGVNDDPKTLAALFRKLEVEGISPYYVFQCRPALGNRTFAVPVEEGYRIFEKAKARVSGPAKRARFVMSHATGKIEIVGRTRRLTYFKYHRAADDGDSSHFLVCRSNPYAYWFDDYKDAVPLRLPEETNDQVGSA